jgi:hypothetical protein
VLQKSLYSDICLPLNAQVMHLKWGSMALDVLREGIYSPVSNFRTSLMVWKLPWGWPDLYSVHNDKVALFQMGTSSGRVGCKIHWTLWTYLTITPESQSCWGTPLHFKDTLWLGKNYYELDQTQEMCQIECRSKSQALWDIFGWNSYHDLRNRKPISKDHKKVA